MNEETNVQAVADEDAIVFDEADFPGGDEGLEAGEEPAEEQAQEEAQPEEEPAGEQPQEEPQQQEEEFELTDGQGTRKVKRAELLELAQRGQGVGRLTQQLEELRKQSETAVQFQRDHGGDLEDLLELAQRSGKSVAEFLDALKVTERMNRTGMKREAAVEEVQAERQTRNQARQEAQRQQEAAQRQQQSAKERMDREIGEFLQAYPDVKAEDVPKEVWEAVGKGVSLLTAYNKYENTRLKAENDRLAQQAAAREKNEANKGKAVGSVQSHGQGKADGFLSGFESAFD